VEVELWDGDLELMTKFIGGGAYLSPDEIIFTSQGPVFTTDAEVAYLWEKAQQKWVTIRVGDAAAKVNGAFIVMTAKVLADNYDLVPEPDFPGLISPEGVRKAMEKGKSLKEAAESKMHTTVGRHTAGNTVWNPSSPTVTWGDGW
jgi:hypothetical protein